MAGQCMECSCRSCVVRHGVGFLERKVPLTTRPALTACDQTAPQADAPAEPEPEAEAGEPESPGEDEAPKE